MTREVRLATMDGYVWNDESEKLEAYEYICAEFHLGKVDITYTARIGGEVRTFTTNELKVYKSEKEFMEHTPLDSVVRYVGWDVLPTHDDFTWVFRNGKAQKVLVSDITCIHNKGKYCMPKERCYESEKDVYRFHDLIVREPDGTERVVECLASKMRMRDDQLQIIGELQELIQRMHDNHIALTFDMDSCKILAYNVEHSDSWVIGYCDDYAKDGYENAYHLEHDVCDMMCEGGDSTLQVRVKK